MILKLWDDDNEVFCYTSFDNLDDLIQTLDGFRDYFSKSYFKDNPEFLTILTKEEFNNLW